MKQKKNKYFEIFKATDRDCSKNANDCSKNAKKLNTFNEHFYLRVKIEKRRFVIIHYARSLRV